MKETRVKIREFLALNLRGHALRDDDDVFSLGLMNSLLAIQLVAFIESEFGITLKDEEIDIDHFRSVDAITNLVERKTGRNKV